VLAAVGTEALDQAPIGVSAGRHVCRNAECGQPNWTFAQFFSAAVGMDRLVLARGGTLGGPAAALFAWDWGDARCDDDVVVNQEWLVRRIPGLRAGGLSVRSIAGELGSRMKVDRTGCW
jgi:hypothetical protein